jgi:hypothetical protein
VAVGCKCGGIVPVFASKVNAVRLTSTIGGIVVGVGLEGCRIGFCGAGCGVSCKADCGVKGRVG